MTLNVVLGPCWCANEVMQVHRGQPSLNKAGIDPCNLQVRIVNKSCVNRSRSPGFWSEPRLNEQDPSREKVMYHTLDSSGEVLQGFDVPNSAEETGDDVKCASKIAIRPIGMMQGDLRMALASDSQ